MKKHQTYLVLLLAVLFSGTMNAKVNNYVGAYGFLGEWTLRPVESDYKPSLGATGGVGFLYEVQAGKAYRPTRFLFNVGVGAWGGMTSFAQGSDMMDSLPNQYDLQGDQFDYMYEIKDRHDQYKNVSIQVPILFGFRHNRFYMLAGAKLNTGIYTKAFTTADVTTFGRYSDIPDLRNQPDYQFFNDRKWEGSTKTSFKLDVNVSLEIGGRLGFVTDASGYDVPKHKVEYRLAGFIDYGIKDIHTTGSKDPFTKPGMYDTRTTINDSPNPDYVYQNTSMVDKLEVNDIMSTSGFAKSVNNLMVGIKFTVLFQLPEEQKCVICQDGYRSSIGNRRGGVKYEE